MKIIVITLSLIVILSIWFLTRRRQRTAGAEQKQIKQDLKATSEFHAVSIKPGFTACAAARSLEGQRYLAAQAPHLPLEDCDAETCECRFAHYDDRRSGRDRRSPFGSGRFIAGTGEFATERRERPDRRRDAGGDE